jgi:hypothetical protein
VATASQEPVSGQDPKPDGFGNLILSLISYPDITYNNPSNSASDLAIIPTEKVDAPHSTLIFTLATELDSARQDCGNG